MIDNYYRSRRSKLPKEFDNPINRAKGAFACRYGEDLTNTMDGRLLFLGQWPSGYYRTRDLIWPEEARWRQ